MQIWNGSDEYCWRYRADTILSTDGQTDKVKPVDPTSNSVEARAIKTACVKITTNSQSLSRLCNMANIALLVAIPNTAQMSQWAAISCPHLIWDKMAQLAITLALRWIEDFPCKIHSDKSKIQISQCYLKTFSVYIKAPNSTNIILKVDENSRPRVFGCTTGFQWWMPWTSNSHSTTPVSVFFLDYNGIWCCNEYKKALIF